MLVYNSVPDVSGDISSVYFDILRLCEKKLICVVYVNQSKK